uniref:Cytochrome c oxidase subunit 3 n=1 Tax=Perna perna TaxID=94826 RepID=A0A0B4U178_PERPR|nr:cytochrome c oxidase subunit III [Perna perna]AJC00157.1 cytochrome c oxidase subunit III [Perna perna]
MERNLYYRVKPSWWPFLTTLCLLSMALGLVTALSGDFDGVVVMGLAALCLICCLSMWWRDLLREGDQGYHSKKVIKNFRDAMAMFIASEVMFFVSFAWAFFHSSLAPDIEVSGTWPPVGVRVPWCFGVPFVNLWILLTSGGFMNVALGKVRCRDYDHWSLLCLFVAIVLGVVFLFLQFKEYRINSFTISDGIYGSTFYMLTGFHGAHVVGGLTFMVVTFMRLWFGHFLSDRCFGMVACAWYWHFVDIVWIGVWVFYYFWGGGLIFNFWYNYWEGDVWWTKEYMNPEVWCDNDPKAWEIELLNDLSYVWLFP